MPKKQRADSSASKIAELVGPSRRRPVIRWADLRLTVAGALRRMRALKSQAGTAAAGLKDAFATAGINTKSELAEVRQAKCAETQQQEKESRFKREVDQTRTFRRRDDAATQPSGHAVRQVAEFESSASTYRYSQVAETSRGMLVNLGKRLASAKSLLNQANCRNRGGAVTSTCLASLWIKQLEESGPGD